MNQRQLQAALLALLLTLTILPLAGTPATQASHSPAHPTLTAPIRQQEPPPLPPGGFIQVTGDQLTRFGRPVILKGVNYYPQWRPWEDMWNYWDAPQMERELRLARDQLGINTLRILLPYDVGGDGRVDERLLRRIRELLQIAGDLDMRVIMTLFDFYNGFPPPGTEEEQENFRYLQRLIGNFAGDERIFAWDIHNEPDHYAAWKEGDAPRVLTWLGRMADEIERLAPNHLITVGVGQYDTLWQPGPDGRTILDYSDVVSFHNYNAPDTLRQIDEIRQRTWKPILLQEFGWPSGPACVVHNYNEAQQAAVYQEMLQAAQGRTAGVIAWTLRDYDAGPTMRWDTREEYYGLYRPDGTLKPAADAFINFGVPPLPSITKTDLELSSKYHRIDGRKAPKLIEPTGHYVKSWFRRAWDNLGGKDNFGWPLSEAYVEPDSGRILQHFSAATLEYHPAEAYQPDFDALPLFAQAQRVIRPLPIGRDYTAGVEFPPQPPVTPGPHAQLFPETGYVVQGKFLEFYHTFSGPWRLGLPISPEVAEQVGDGTYTMQYFENGRLDYSPVTNAVTFGGIGYALWDRQCRFE